MRMLPGCLLVGLVLGTGCVITEGDGDDAPDDRPDANNDPDPDAEPLPLEGDAHITWPIVVAGQTSLTCPEGATTAAVYAQLGDEKPYVDLFDCETFEGTVADLPEGSYAFWVDVTDDAGTTVYLESPVVEADVVAGDVIDVDIPIDGVQYFGSWELSWQLRDGGQNLTCAQVPDQNGVSVVSSHNATAALYDSVYDCAVGQAPQDVLIDPIPVGAYVVTLSVLDANDESIGDSAPMNSTIAAGAGVVDLGTIIIELL